MSKIATVLLRSVMGAIMAIAALVAGVVTAPFVLVFWVIRFLKEVMNGAK